MMGVRNEPDGIDAEFVTVAMLVRVAFGGLLKLPTDDSVTGLPDWAKTDYFNVQAKMSREQTAEFAKMSKDAQEAAARGDAAGAAGGPLQAEGASRSQDGSGLRAGGGERRTEDEEASGADPSIQSGRHRRRLHPADEGPGRKADRGRLPDDVSRMAR